MQDITSSESALSSLDPLAISVMRFWDTSGVTNLPLISNKSVMVSTYLDSTVIE